jgi:hypothetical protein
VASVSLHTQNFGIELLAGVPTNFPTDINVSGVQLVTVEIPGTVTRPRIKHGTFSGTQFRKFGGRALSRGRHYHWFCSNGAGYVTSWKLEVLTTNDRRLSDVIARKWRKGLKMR